MENALVVVEDSTASKELVAEAGRFATAQDATVYLLVMVSEDELARTISTLDRIGSVENTTYNDETAIRQAESFVEDIAADALDQTISYEPVIHIVDDGDQVETTLEAARAHDCDHIFTAGRKRSPTGKALFGDFTQSLLLDFDGKVTVDLTT